MKKLILTLATIVVIFTTGRGQSFEGIIDWSLKFTINDKEMIASSAQATQLMLEDTAAQRRIKTLEENMTNPEFKATIDADRETRLQVYALLLLYKSGGDINQLMPSGLTLKLKGNNTLVSTHGAAQDGDDGLYIGDKKTDYHIDHPSKSYSVITEPRKKFGPSKITKTSETTKILNYKCRKYFIEQTNDDGASTVTYWYWATEDIKGINRSVLVDQNFGTEVQIFFDEIPGMPMRIEMKGSPSDLVMECTAVDRKKLPSTDFEIPGSYTEKTF